MPPTRNQRVTHARYAPYRKSKMLMKNLTTFLKERDYKKNYAKYYLEKFGVRYTSAIPERLRGREMHIASMMKTLLTFFEFHLNKSPLSKKLNFLETFNDTYSLYEDDLQQYINHKDGGKTLLLSMMIPYYIYIADIANELFEELDMNDKLPHEIIDEAGRLEKLLISSSMIGEVDDLADLMGKL